MALCLCWAKQIVIPVGRDGKKSVCNLCTAALSSGVTVKAGGLWNVSCWHTHTPIHIHTHTHKVCNSKATQKGVLGPIKTCWWSGSCKWNVMKCCCLLLSWFTSSHCDLRLYETTTATDKSILFFPLRCLCMCVKRQSRRVYYVQNIKNHFQIQGWEIWSDLKSLKSEKSTTGQNQIVVSTIQCMSVPLLNWDSTW